MEEHMDLMADLVQKLSSDLRAGFRPAYDNFIGFFYAIDWKVALQFWLSLSLFFVDLFSIQVLCCCSLLMGCELWICGLLIYDWQHDYHNALNHKHL